jgi:putative ABC transport system permease protein
LTPALLKDTLRTMARTMSRFLSIFAIVALGVGFFAGVRATGSDMRLTADLYYDRTQTADVHVLSTMGFSQKDVDAAAAIPGVSGVMPAHSVDVLTLAGENFTTKVLSLPDLELSNPGYQNQLSLVEGRLPEAPYECVLDSAAAEEMGFSVGRVITLASGTADQDLSDTLYRKSYTIVGIAESPLYIDMTKRGNTTIGNGTLSAFLYVPEENFVSDVYTDLYLTWGPALPLAAYTDEYDQEVEKLLDALEELETVRAPARLEEVRAEAQAEIDDALKELEDGRQEMNEKLADAWQELEDGRQELLDGEEEYRQGVQDFEEEIEKAQQELDDAKAELDDGWAQYRDGRDQLREGEKELRESLPLLQAAEAQAQEQTTQLETLKASLAAVDPALPISWETHGQLLGALDAVTDQEGASLGLGSSLADGPEMEGLPPEAQQAVRTQKLAGVEGALDTAIQTITAAIQEARRQYDQGVEDLQDGRSELREARKELERGRAEYEDGLAEFEEEKAKGQQELDDARLELDDGWKELEDGQREYEEEKADAEAEIADGEAEIRDAQQELADLEMPEWYIQDRYDFTTAYSSYRDDAQRIDNVAAIFPAFFLGVAALVCLTTMTRMVEEQRGQIGTAKALGYTSGAIAAKYLIYAVTASLLGSLVGLAVGFWIFPTVIYNAYRILYDMPEITAPFWWGTGLVSCLAATAVSALVTASACWGELRAVPAQIMRPKAPKAGKRVLLERIPFIWRRLSFIQKVTVRNLFRYKKRVLMTVTGIAGCTALMLAGFGLNDAINDILGNQYVYIITYDMMVLYQNDGDAADLAALDNLTGTGNDLGITARADQYVQSMTALSPETGKRVDVNLTVTKEPEEIGEFITLRTRLGHEPLSIPEDGAIITEKMASLLDLSVGDQLTIQDPDGAERLLRVAGITENYASHFVYLGPEYYQEVFGQAPEYNCQLLNLQDPSLENSVSGTLLENPSVLAVNLTSTIRAQFGNISDSFKLVIVVLVISAGLLAFVVLYNLTNINITERIREIATLKVLGFYDREVSAYIYRENTALTFLGIAFGLLLGAALTRFVVVTAEIDAIMFGRKIYFFSYAIAAALTLAFSVFVNFVMHFRLRKVDMVESMKSVD